jgi:hypothetical protein
MSRPEWGPLLAHFIDLEIDYIELLHAMEELPGPRQPKHSVRSV